MDRVVTKFGGSSVSDAHSIDAVVRALSRHLEAGDKLAVVTSAMGVSQGSKGRKVTDLLFDISRLAREGSVYEAREIVWEIEKRHHEIESHYGVLGATAKLLNDLERHVDRRYPDISEKAVDDIFASYGERLMATDLVAILTRQGVPAFVVDTISEGGFTTDSNYGEASLLPQSLSEIAAQFIMFSSLPINYRRIPVYTGYIARNESGKVTTLGRDGSNTTALALGAAIHARKIIIYSDVPGVQAVSPGYLPDAQTVRTLSYAEMLALAERGANVFQPNSLKILGMGRLPQIHIRDTRDPGGLETLVLPQSDRAHSGMKGIGVLSDIYFRECPIQGAGQYEILLNVISGHPGVSVLRSELLANGKEMVARFVIKAEPGMVALTGDPEHYRESLGLRIISDAYGGKSPKGTIRLSRAGLVSVVGDGIGKSGRALGTIEDVLAEVTEAAETERSGSAIKAGGESLVGQTRQLEDLRHHLPPHVERDRIDVIVPKLLAVPMVRGLYQRLKHINLIVYGAGKIGLPFLERAAAAYEELGLNVVGVVDSTGYVTRVGGISQRELEQLIAHKKQGAGIGLFNIKHLKGYIRAPQEFTHDHTDQNLGISEVLIRNGTGDFILVDATGDEGMQGTLVSALKKGARIVTANKKPFVSGNAPEQEGALNALYRGVLEGNVFNRATVGANLGAPDTLAEILRQNPYSVTVLCSPSGTNGYICSRMDNGTRFSAAVREAAKEGHTETRPYEDLSGLDALRKATILTRMISYHYGGVPVTVNHETFLDHANSSLAAAMDIGALGSLGLEEFLEAAKAFDAPFAGLVSEAAKSGCVLRYVVSIEPKNGGYDANIGLRPVHRESILGSTTGPENVFLFGVNGEKPRLYFPPGPGAGVEVTVNALMAGVEKFVREFRA